MKKRLLPALIALLILPALAFAQKQKDSMNAKAKDTLLPPPSQYALVLNEQDLQILTYVIDNSQAEHSLVKKVLAFLQQNIRVLNPPQNKQRQ